MAEEQQGEGKEVHGEGGKEYPQRISEPEVIVERRLTFEEACKCLNTLGKDESGMRYAYLMITVTDRKLTHIDMILHFKHVLFVDVSGNYLTLANLQVLEEMPFLILLKAERNRVESGNLIPLPFLQVLELSKNYIMETANLNQPMLEVLNFSYNQILIPQFDGVGLTSLKQLDLKGNYLTAVAGTFPPTLESLYLADNRITKIISQDISSLTCLTRLHLRENHIRKLDGFTDKLENLAYLNLRKNKINKFRQFRKLQCLPKLDTLIVSQNPVTGDAEEEVKGEGGDEEDADEAEKEDISRIPLLTLLPNLKRINKNPVSKEELEEVAEGREEKLEEILAEESSDEETGSPTDNTTDYSTDN